MKKRTARRHSGCKLESVASGDSFAAGEHDKARFYAIARGCATECAAIVEIGRLRGLASGSTCWQARALLIRIVQMLSKLGAHLGG